MLHNKTNQQWPFEHGSNNARMNDGRRKTPFNSARSHLKKKYYFDFVLLFAAPVAVALQFFSVIASAAEESAKKE